MSRYCLYLFIVIHLFVLPATGHADKNTRTILILGDSISAAYGIEPEEGWVQLLQTRLQNKGYADYQVINGSISGSTSGDGLARLPGLLEQYNPEIIIIELGGNDGLRGYPINIMHRNLQQLIDLSLNAKARVLLAGIEIPPNYGPRYTTTFRDSYQQLAAKNPVAFLPFILEGVGTKADLMQDDGIHPTAEAQIVLLDNVWEPLKGLL